MATQLLSAEQLNLQLLNDDAEMIVYVPKLLSATLQHPCPTSVYTNSTASVVATVVADVDAACVTSSVDGGRVNTVAIVGADVAVVGADVAVVGADVAVVGADVAVVGADVAVVGADVAVVGSDVAVIVGAVVAGVVGTTKHCPFA
jgi:hypothetical protein